MKSAEISSIENHAEESFQIAMGILASFIRVLLQRIYLAQK